MYKIIRNLPYYNQATEIHKFKIKICCHLATNTQTKVFSNKFSEARLFWAAVYNVHCTCTRVKMIDY